MALAIAVGPVPKRATMVFHNSLAVYGEPPTGRDGAAGGGGGVPHCASASALIHAISGVPPQFVLMAPTGTFPPSERKTSLA